MGFDIGKIKNLFVETTVSADTSVDAKNSTIESSKVESAPSTKAEKLDQTIIESLQKAIKDNNLPGEDYLEFVEALNAMQNIPLEDSMKVQTVMATLSVKGLTVAKIKESAEYYKKVLENEQNQFSAELTAQVEKSIKTKQSGIESLNNSIKLKTDQIALLTKEITEAQQNVSATEAIIKAAELKIKTAQENFNAAYNFVINQINENLSKLK